MMKPFAPKIWGILFFLACGCNGAPPESGVCAESPGALYERRVAPLFEASNPSSCSQCHAGGLDLAAFVRSDPCESMACLLDQGLVNLDNPERSVLLSWIARAEPESDLITAGVVREEYQAFESWIEHESICRACANTECSVSLAAECEVGDDLSAPFDEGNDPLGCDAETLERLFRGTIYKDRGRCNPCHFQEETKAAPGAPRWLSRTGDCRVASLATYQNIVAEGYIDVQSPSKSLLLQKPLAEFQGGVPHGGHDKFVLEGDGGYRAFLYFVERYASCKIGSEFEFSAGGSSGE